MTPHKELECLNLFIKLSENEAVKRDCLERFLAFDDYVLLIDADSIVYNVCHFWMDKELVFSDMIEDFHAQVRGIALHIEDAGYPIADIETFFTACTDNFRLEIDKEYKAHREVTELSKTVYHLKDEIISNILGSCELCHYDDELEADDLIPKMLKEYGKGNEIIVSIDKDLKQITGCHFDYYKVKTGEKDENGYDLKEYRGFSFTTDLEGEKILAGLLLEGDVSDNVKGVKGIGKKTAAKLLKDKSSYGLFRAVTKAYIEEGKKLGIDWKKKLQNNYKLVNLR